MLFKLVLVTNAANLFFWSLEDGFILKWYFRKEFLGLLFLQVITHISLATSTKQKTKKFKGSDIIYYYYILSNSNCRGIITCTVLTVFGIAADGGVRDSTFCLASVRLVLIVI